MAKNQGVSSLLPPPRKNDRFFYATCHESPFRNNPRNVFISHARKTWHARNGVLSKPTHRFRLVSPYLQRGLP